MTDREKLLAFFREKTGRPLPLRDIVALLQLNHKEARALKRTLRSMVRSGDIVFTRKGLYGPAEDMNLISGYFEQQKDGYGFVIMEKPGERDIFIPARSTMGAMNSDRVLVRVGNRQRREGEIVRVLERANTKIAGKFEVTKAGFYVKPKNRYLNFDILIAQKNRAGAKNRDMVVVEILTYPTERKPAVGKVVKILGEPDDPKAEVEAIIDEFNLPRRFPRAVHEETVSISIPKSEGLRTRSGMRKDLRHLSTVTIDGERAKDFDDAVSVEVSKQGYTLYVHIADVGFYVGWNSIIDLEARSRGTSVYFPDRVIPMLPKELSEDLCSLKPGLERLAFTAEMKFDRNGHRTGSKFYPSVIVSDERMTYTSVKKILVDNDGHERGKYVNLLHDFELMGELCSLLRNRRLLRGSLDFDLPEPEVLLDMQGRPEAVLRSERNYAHMIIEEFMIAANEAVAEHLSGLGIPALYRIHEEPDPLKLEDILRVMKTVRKVRHPLRPKDFHEILRDIKGKPEEEIINYMVLRSLKQARYSPINVGHFGLASECYAHFTSPIRRYPDLVLHRILREVLNRGSLPGKRIHELDAMLPDIAFQSSRMERVAEKAETEVINGMRAWFMKDKAGEEFDAKVVNVTPYGVKVRLREFYVEGFLHVSHMTDDFYQFDERRMSLNGRHTRRSFSIGKELKVRLDRVDMEEREIILDIV
jgi:ribonuclease R